MWLIFYRAGYVMQKYCIEGGGRMGLHEEHIVSKMARLSLSRQVLALLVDIQVTVLCRGLQNVRPLSGPDILRINQTLDDLIGIQRIISPLVLPITDVVQLKVLLHKFHDDGLDKIVDAEIVLDLRQKIAAIQNL
jgi:hypothetical protein